MELRELGQECYGFTPEQVFTDRYKEIAIVKQQVLDDPYRLNPERLPNGKPIAVMPNERVLNSSIIPEEKAERASNVGTSQR